MAVERRYLESTNSFRDRKLNDQIIRDVVHRDPHIPSGDKGRVADTAAKIVDGGSTGLNWGQIRDVAKKVEGV